MATLPWHLLSEGRALLMFLDLTGDERGGSDCGKMVSASTTPTSPSSPTSTTTAAAATSGRSFKLCINLRLIGIVVDVVMALQETKERKKRRKLHCMFNRLIF